MTPPRPRRGPSAAELARLAAGYSVADVARFLRTSEAAVRRMERTGRGWSLARAERLAWLFRCRIEAFPAGGKTRPCAPRRTE